MSSSSNFDVTKVRLLEKGTSGFEPETSRSAVECSTTEQYPRKIGDYDVKRIPYVALFAIPQNVHDFGEVK